MPIAHHRAVVLALAFTACDREQAPAPAATTAVQVESPVPTAADRPTPPVVEPVAKPTPSPSEPLPPATPTTPTPPADDESFGAVIDRLAKRLPQEPSAGKLGFARLKAAKLDEAATYFAQASKLDTVAWKHPFNLACAAALAKDDALARVALVETVRRGGEVAAAKARRDPDLARLRLEAWFEPVLRGEPPPIATPPVAPATPVVPATPIVPVTPIAPVIPTTPTEPIAPAEPTPPPEPPIAMKPLPRGTSKAIAKKNLAPIVVALTTTHRAKPVIHGSLEYVDALGATMRWVVYEFSLFDACLAEQTDKKAGRRLCREKIGVTPGSGQCNEQGIALVTSIDPVAIGHDEPLDVSCKLRKVTRFEVADYDGDRHDEILVDVRGRYDLAEYRTAGETDYVRAVRFLRPDGSTQLAFDVAWNVSHESELIEETARKLGVRATKDEGMHDLVMAMRTFEATPEELDAELWPSDDVEAMGPILTEVWPYDPVADTWREPSE